MISKDIVYSTEIRCVFTAGGLPDPYCVGVKDAKGRIQSLPIPNGLVVIQDDVAYLPVLIFRKDQETQWYLVELPYEADSGSRRIWVHLSEFRQVG